MPVPAPPSRRPRRRRRRPPALVAGAFVLAGLVLAGLVLAGPVAAPAGGQPTPPPADSCAGVDTTVRLVGSTSAKEAMSHWGLAICRDAGVLADFTDLGSRGGREAVTPADAEVIGLTALPFTDEEEAALVEQERQVVLVPVLATSVVCTYWDTNPFDPAQAGRRFPDLRISRRTLADIYGGSPRDGSNYSPELAADNAANPAFVTGPPFLQIEPWLRSGASSVTYQITDWFAQDEEAAADFLKSSFAGTTLPFEETPVPSGSSPQILNDYSTMISRMITAPQALGLGCMDAATAQTDIRPETPEADRLNAAWLDNASGAFVAPTADAVSRSVAAMTPHEDGTFSPDWSFDDPAAYPLPLVVYAALPTCGISAPARDAMDDVVAYMLGTGQGDLPPGNVPLPEPVATTAATQFGRWRDATAAVAPCGEAPATTTTSAPTRGPGTVPGFDPGGSGGGVLTDPGLVAGAGGLGTGGGLGSGADLGAVPGTSAAPGDEAAAAGAADAPGAEADSGPLAPLRRIVAIATGASAVPPLLVLFAGVVLLAGGPALQIAGGRRRVGSLAWSATAWFRRLRP